MSWWDYLTAHLYFGLAIAFCPRLLLGVIFFANYLPGLAVFAWLCALVDLVRWLRSDEGQRYIRRWLGKF